MVYLMIIDWSVKETIEHKNPVINTRQLLGSNFELERQGKTIYFITPCIFSIFF